jgi:hypothetical protein
VLRLPTRRPDPPPHVGQHAHARGPPAAVRSAAGGPAQTGGAGSRSACCWTTPGCRRAARGRPSSDCSGRSCQAGKRPGLENATGNQFGGAQPASSQHLLSNRVGSCHAVEHATPCRLTPRSRRSCQPEPDILEVARGRWLGGSSVLTASGAAYTHSAVTATRRRSAMASVAELADEDARRRVAGPIEYRQGVDLAVGGCVRLASLGSVPVTARVEDLIFQHVELRSTGTGLGWSCTRRDGRTPAALHAQRRRRRGDPAATPVPATLNVRVAAKRLAQRSAAQLNP